MKLVYLAGPYRSKNGIHGIVRNIETASAVALILWRLGLAVICPHKNTSLFDGAAPDDVWLKGDIEMLSRCDAIVMMDTWKQSNGAIAEHDFAEKKGIPIFYLPDDSIRLEEFAGGA